MKNQEKSMKIPFTGIGLVFGTAIGAGIALALGQPIYWAGAGTGIGLVIGAIIDSTKKAKDQSDDGTKLEHTDTER